MTRAAKESMTFNSPVEIESFPSSIPCHDRDNLVVPVICGQPTNNSASRRLWEQLAKKALLLFSWTTAAARSEGRVTITVVNVNRRFPQLTNRDASPDTRSFCYKKLLTAFARAPYAEHLPVISVDVRITDSYGCIFRNIYKKDERRNFLSYFLWNRCI